MILSVAIINNSGKALVARQFSKVSKAQIVNHLSVFPKLLTKSSQSYVESANIRYVYQEIDKLYFVLITTKDSNILEDLELLQMLTDLTREIIPQIDETTVLERNLDLILAYDEVIFDGYRQTVSVSEVMTFLSMESQEELMFLNERQKKEEDAKKVALETQKNLDKAKKSKSLSTSNAVGFVPVSTSSVGNTQSPGFTPFSSVNTEEIEPIEETKPKRQPRTLPEGSRGMVLGKMKSSRDRAKQVILEEGLTETPTKSKPAAAPEPIAVITKGLLLKLRETLKATFNREGNVRNLSLRGELSARGTSRAKYAIQMNWDDKFTSIPRTFMKTKQVTFDNTEPKAEDASLLHWGWLKTVSDDLPFKLDCWPRTEGDISRISLVFETLRDDVSIGKAKIKVRLDKPSDATIVVTEENGEVETFDRDGYIIWTTPEMTVDNNSAEIEIAAKQEISDFFEIHVEIDAPHLLSQIDVANVFKCNEDGEVDENSPAQYEVQKQFCSSGSDITVLYDFGQ